MRIPLCSQIGILTNSVVRGGDLSNLRRASGGEFVLARGLDNLGLLALGLEAHGDASQQEEQGVVDRRVAHFVKQHLHGVSGQSAEEEHAVSAVQAGLSPRVNCQPRRAQPMRIAINSPRPTRPVSVKRLK